MSQDVEEMVSLVSGVSEVGPAETSNIGFWKGLLKSETETYCYSSWMVSQWCRLLPEHQEPHLSRDPDLGWGPVPYNHQLIGCLQHPLPPGIS